MTGTLVIVVLLVAVVVVIMFRISASKRPCPFCRTMMPKSGIKCPHCHKPVPLAY